MKEQLIAFRSLKDSATTNKSVGIDTGIGETKNFIAVGNTASSKEVVTVILFGNNTPGK